MKFKAIVAYLICLAGSIQLSLSYMLYQKLAVTHTPLPFVVLAGCSFVMLIGGFLLGWRNDAGLPQIDPRALKGVRRQRFAEPRSLPGL